MIIKLTFFFGFKSFEEERFSERFKLEKMRNLVRDTKLILQKRLHAGNLFLLNFTLLQLFTVKTTTSNFVTAFDRILGPIIGHFR